MARNVRVVTGPPDELDRARQLADALTVQALRPRRPPVGGPVQVAMSPWEGIAQLGEAFIAGKSQQYAKKLAEAQRAAQEQANETMVGQMFPDRASNPQAAIPQALRDPNAGNTAPYDPQGAIPQEDPRKAQLAAAMQGVDPAVAGQALSGALMQRAMAVPKTERVDLGDSIGILDESGRIIGQIPKGATPDAQLREQGENFRFVNPSGNARLSADVAVRGQDVGAATARRGQDVTMRGQDLSYDATVRGQGASQAQNVQGKAAAWDMYEQARTGLLSALDSTVTGPFASGFGFMPALTADQQKAEGAVSAMAPVLKQLFRVAGEGTFTDRDQALLLEMVPTRKDRPEAAAWKIQNIDNIVRAKLGIPQPAPGAEGQPGQPWNGLSPEVMQRAEGYYGKP